MGMVFQQVFKQFDTLLPFTPYFSHAPSRPCQWNLRHGTSSKWSRSCKAFTTSVILLRGVLASSSTAAKVTGSWRLIVAAFSSHISLTHWWLQSCNKCIKPVLNNDINNLSACAGISVINSIIIVRALIMNSQILLRIWDFWTQKCLSSLLFNFKLRQCVRKFCHSSKDFGAPLNDLQPIYTASAWRFLELKHFTWK